MLTGRSRLPFSKLVKGREIRWEVSGERKEGRAKKGTKKGKSWGGGKKNSEEVCPL